MVETIDGYEKLRELLSAEMAKATTMLADPNCTIERALEIQRWAASLEKALVKNRLRAERGFRRLLREMNQPQPRRIGSTDVVLVQVKKEL